MAFDSAQEAAGVLARLGIVPGEGDLVSRSPIDGRVIGSVTVASADEVEAAIGRAQEAFLAWRTVPPPSRREMERLFGEVQREEKE